MTLVRCPFCRRLIGITVDGEVLCEKLGKVPLMRVCRYFEPRGNN